MSTMNLPATAATAATSSMAPRATRRLRIRHTTRVAYAQPAASSHNEVRMTPLTLPGQTTLDARVLVNPSTPTWSYWDYWGTQVTGFDRSPRRAWWRRPRPSRCRTRRTGRRSAG